MRVSSTNWPLPLARTPCNTAWRIWPMNAPKPWCRRPLTKPVGKRTPSRNNAHQKAIGWSGRAWPMPVMCTASGRALVQPGRRGWRMCVSTKPPARCRCSGWWSGMTQAWWSTPKGSSSKSMAMSCKPPAAPCWNKCKPMPRMGGSAARSGAVTPSCNSRKCPSSKWCKCRAPWKTPWGRANPPRYLVQRRLPTPFLTPPAFVFGNHPSPRKWCVPP